MQLQDHRRTAVVEAADIDALPQGAGAVERLHRAVAGNGEHPVERARGVQLNGTEVVGDLDGLVEHPLGRPGAQWGLDDPLSQAGHES